jgi:membrane dipeptidase
MKQSAPSLSSRRECLKHLVSLVPLAAAPMFNIGRYRLFANSGTEYSERAVRLMQEATVIDMRHMLTAPFERFEGWPGGVNVTVPETLTAEHFAVIRKTGVNVFAIGALPGRYNNAVYLCAAWNGLIATHDDYLMRIDSGADLERVKTSGKAGVLFSFQTADHFEEIDHVDVFHDFGQRVGQLVYSARNLLGNGAFERRDDGLSDYGLQVVERMNKIGMAVDGAHAGDRTLLDALDASKAPMIFSHDTCRGLMPGYLRAKSDEAIRRLARSGGVMGIAFIRFMVHPTEPTTMEHVLDHIDYVRSLVGVEHVGIGSDFGMYSDANPAAIERLHASLDPRYNFHGRDGIERLDHPQRMFDLVDGLIQRKYTDNEIKLILGGNFKRVLTQIWG